MKILLSIIQEKTLNFACIHDMIIDMLIKKKLEPQ